MERPLHCPCPPPVPELAKEPGAPALMPGATLVLPCLMPCGPGAQEHLAWFQIDWTGSEPPSQAVTSILPSPSPSCSPGGKGPAGAAPKALWGLTQNLAPEPRCRVWGFTTALCPGGLPLVGKMLADPEPVPSDRQCPMFGPKGGVETRLGSSGPVCLLTRTSPHALTARVPRRGVWGAGQRPASMTRRRGSPWMCPAPARAALMTRLFLASASPWGASSPSWGDQPTTPPVLKAPPAHRGLSGRMKDSGRSLLRGRLSGRWDGRRPDLGVRAPRLRPWPALH